jgi:serine O-acetyltransferase
MLSIIREDLRTHREGILAQGFWALLCHRLSHPRMRCRIPVVRQIWYMVNRIAGKTIEITTGIMLPESAQIGRRLQIEHFGAIIIHGHSVIGDDCLIRQGVTLGNIGAGYDGAPRIGNRVEIGAGAKIIGPVTVGDGAVIGANAVVLRDIPPGWLAVGVPAVARPRKTTTF